MRSMQDMDGYFRSPMWQRILHPKAGIIRFRGRQTTRLWQNLTAMKKQM